VRVFAFFGSDLGDSPFPLLRQLLEEGHQILALDAAAIGRAAVAGVADPAAVGAAATAAFAASPHRSPASVIPFTVIDDWIPPESLERIRQRARECERAWFEAGRDAFTSDGVCWSELDRRAMTWFWRDVLLAEEFAKRFVERGGRELRFVGRTVPRPCVYYGRSDVWAELWKARLGARAVPLPDPAEAVAPPTVGDLLGRVRGGLASGVKHAAGWLGEVTGLKPGAGGDPSHLGGKTVLAFNMGEYHRLTPVARALATHRPGKAAAVTFFGAEANAARIAGEWGIPVLYSPKPLQRDPGLQTRLLEGLARVRAAASPDAPWRPVLEHLGFHFEHYCAERWPMLAAWFEWWTDLWRRARPEAVLTTSLDDTESQLPAAAANRLGIPTASVPHAGVAPGEDVLSVKFMIYGLPLQRRFAHAAHVADSRLIPCRDLLAESEYHPGRLRGNVGGTPKLTSGMGGTPKLALGVYSNPASAPPPNQFGGATRLVGGFPQQLAVRPSDSASEAPWRVLVLTNPCAHRGSLMPGPISFGLQLEALRALAHPPEDVAPRLSLHVKVHPGFPELELFQAAGGNLAERVLPPNSSLQSALDEADLVVALNYAGSALLHALLTDKVVLFFSTRPSTVPYPMAEFFDSAGETAHTPDALWNALRAFFTDPERADRMRAACGEFARTNLAADDYPDIGQAVNTMLTRSRG